MNVGLNPRVTIRNTLVDVYGKCENGNASMSVFNEMVYKNEVSWNVAITSLYYVGHDIDALDMFRSIIILGFNPNFITISNMLAIVKLGFFKARRNIHRFKIRMSIESGIFIIFVANLIIEGYM